MTDEQQCLAAPYCTEWNGKKLQFAPVVQNVKADCVAACKLSAIKECEENLPLMFPGTDSETLGKKRQYMERFEADMTTGRYKWGGDLQEQWRTHSEEGVLTFIGSLLKAGGTPLMRDEIEDYMRDRPSEMGAIVLLSLWDINNAKKKMPKSDREKLLSHLTNSTPPNTTPN